MLWGKGTILANEADAVPAGTPGLAPYCQSSRIAFLHEAGQVPFDAEAKQAILGELLRDHPPADFFVQASRLDQHFMRECRYPHIFYGIPNIGDEPRF